MCLTKSELISNHYFIIIKYLKKGSQETQA